MNGKDAVTCAEARGQFALLLYGELSFDEEERVETHLDACPECRAGLEREKALLAAADSVAVEPSPSLLRECRTTLASRLNLEQPPRPAHAGWWEEFTQAFTGVRLILRPAGALALVALGFFGAKLAPSLNVAPAGVVEAGMARVRQVEPAADGQVQIVLDETRQRTISGDLDDGQIRALLLEAARDPNDPGLRAESVDILNTRAESADVRDALMYSLSHDQNAGVRLKALEGLKAFAEDPEVRRALSQVLMNDANPGVRSQAIDLLVPQISGNGPVENIDRQTIGTLQELMLHEENPYVRQRCQRVLAALNASSEIY